MYREAQTRERAHDDAVWSVCWTQSNLLATGSVDEIVKCWDPADLSQPKYAFDGNELAIVSVSSNRDGSSLAASSMDGRIRIFSLADGKRGTTINCGALETWTVSHHPVEPIVASGTHQGNVNLWDTGTGQRVCDPLALEGGFVMSVAFSPDGHLLAAATYSGGVQIFDVGSRKAVKKLGGHVKPVRSLSWSPDSSLLLSASDDCYVHAYECKTGEQIASLSGHQSWVLGVSWSPSGKQFATGGADRKVKVWDFGTRECVHTFEKHQNQVWGVAYNPAGQQLASVSDDGSLQIYDTVET